MERPARAVSRRQAWVLMLTGWLALPLSFVLLWSILPPHQDRPLVTAFLLMFEVMIVAGLLWWGGVGQQGFRFQKPVFLVVGLLRGTDHPTRSIEWEGA